MGEATEDNSKKEAMTSNEANGDEAETSQEGSSNLESSTNATNGDKESICRDFMRNVCTRGKRCKYAHPESKGETNNAATLLQDSIVFCHDFQNRNDCSRRHNCRFIHCRKEEEEEFKRSGYLPPHVRDQAINKGVAPDLPALYGVRPICKDFLKGECRRGRLCRFRHLSPRQYDMEMSGYEYESYHQDYGYDRMGYEPPLGPPGPAQPHSMADLDMLQQENMLLKSRVEELKKQVQELTTTNNFLLEQNASLRLSVKGPQPQPIPM